MRSGRLGVARNPKKEPFFSNVFFHIMILCSSPEIHKPCLHPMNMPNYSKKCTKEITKQLNFRAWVAFDKLMPTKGTKLEEQKKKRNIKPQMLQIQEMCKWQNMI
jgi:hypothetical protein